MNNTPIVHTISCCENCPFCHFEYEEDVDRCVLTSSRLYDIDMQVDYECPLKVSPVLVELKNT